MVGAMALQFASLLGGDGWRCGIAARIVVRQQWLALWRCSLHRRLTTMAMAGTTTRVVV
jgi:hypothetical protein